MKVDVDADNLYKGKIDGQGRKYIDRGLIGETVTVALVEVHDGDKSDA
jgi:hypothetical protein